MKKFRFTAIESGNSYYSRRRRRWHRLPFPAKLAVFVILLVLCSISLYAVLGGDFQPVRALMSAIAPSPTPTPTPQPTATPTPTPTPSPTPTPPPPGKEIKDVVVVIDPGHGGYDPGTTSPYDDGLYEKDIVLDIGFRLKKKLEDAGIKVLMTREEDKALHSFWKEDVWARPRIANEAGATFFVSIHVNAFEGKNWQVYNGTEVYYYGKTHGEYTDKQFAQMMGEEIDKVTDTKYNGVIKNDLGVLRLAEMPAVLVETAYITNEEDHKRLESDEFREAMAEGILNGTMRILEEYLGAYKEHGKYKILVDIGN
ncbi:MAG: N-acetylmuramoyl-L-alanine amidase [Clostridiaceae bacterium]|nr:N-acetylmuramoyl-L-alanine amidase [Clostridiaceae bacterium]